MLSLRHDDPGIAQTVETAAEAFTVLRRVLDFGPPADCLQWAAVKPVFRRWNATDVGT